MRHKIPPSIAFRQARERLEMTQEAFSRALGYSGTPRALSLITWRFEAGQRPIPPAIERLAYMYGRFGIPTALERLTFK